MMLEEDKSEIIIPGEKICNADDYMAGHGAYEEKGAIYASLAGTVQRADKLIYVKPLKARYHPEVGDVVVGRIVSLESKKWRVDINAAHYANLLLTAITLPGGEQRRRSEEDKLHMREFYSESEILSGEVQSIGSFDGSANLHTRNLKYGKLMNGVLVQVQPHLIRRMKHHFVTFEGAVKLIIGTNGYLWIYYSPVTLTEETLVGREAQGEQKSITEIREVPLEARQQIARIRNAILALEAKGWPIYLDTIRLVYEESMKSKIPITDMTKPAALQKFSKVIEACLMKEARQDEIMEDVAHLGS